MVKKTRKSIPRKTREAVMGLFLHKCAFCGREKPQLHHIDENPSNNEETNLLPLCPNCHWLPHLENSIFPNGSTKNLYLGFSTSHNKKYSPISEESNKVHPLDCYRHTPVKISSQVNRQIRLCCQRQRYCVHVIGLSRHCHVTATHQDQTR